MTRIFQTVQKSTQSSPKFPYVVLCLIALFAGAIFSFALAPYYLYPLAVLSPAVLYALLSVAKNSRQAFWLGEIYGFGTWAVGGFWLYTSINQYGNVSPTLSVVLIGIMAIIMGLFHAVMSWIFARFTAKQPLSFAGLWVVQEWLKTWLLTGFPWLFVGYAFTEVGWLNGIAPIFGVFGLSFLAVLLAASGVELIRKKAGYFVISATLLLLTVTISLLDIAWTKPTGTTTSVSLVQGNIPQDLKWREGVGVQTLGIYAGLSQAEWGRDLVIWPETAIPMLQDDAEADTATISAQANAAGSTWITGIVYRLLPDDVADVPKLYNSVMLFDGKQPLVYQKQQLVPFGEYIPFGGLLNILPGLEGMDMTGLSRGDATQPLLVANGQKLGTAICYEVAYPNTTRRNALGSDFLLTVSNDAWFGTSAGPIQHLQMVQMRSLEMGRWFVRATNNGVTALIDQKGRIVSRLPQFERGVLRGDVPSFVGKTPYMLWGYYPVLVLAAVLIVLSMIAAKMSKTTAKREKFYTAKGVADR
ncbi:Apolipoprotein N-acyltransferase [Moraxella cuniculi DSM 21768]|uniref:Apolipoprotein N-acyltransferase n=1 Tax=Moraxella cuniculi DSM 21768 TaxID=1122245 RepID=A0A1N7E5H0_9GAMM|nr:apolipoprotein N-acyltransferase [Moraxella cuniculi]OOS06634.1 apolipoprotein N-acyltransferase [Moraxella cuniculi]SIR83274.1 Apolipoprotein N-acyltransferase [Moraxella cuniculi DSM 21768]